MCLAIGIPYCIVCSDALTDGGFESVDRYPTMYAHVNAEIKKALDAGWDCGTEASFQFPFWWYPSTITRGGRLAVSKDAHAGNYSIELGRGGEICSVSYQAATGETGRLHLRKDCSCIVRVWAKGTGKLLVRFKEFDGSGAPMPEVNCGVGELSLDWREHVFIYTSHEERAREVQLAFAVEGLGNLDDASLEEVVELRALVRQLNNDLKSAQDFVRVGVVPGRQRQLQSAAVTVQKITEKTAPAGLSVPEELVLREKIAPVASFLADIVWQGKGTRAGRIGLSSDRLKVEFFGKGLNYRLASISDPRKSVNFFGRFGSEVWRISLTNPTWKPSSDPAAQAPAQCVLTSDSKCSLLQHRLITGGRGLTLEWKGIAIPDSTETLAVRVSVEIPKGSRVSRWRIHVSGGLKRYAISEVNFPVLSSLRPMSDGGKEDYLAIPYGPGRLIRDPYHLKSLSLKYPSGMTMQCWALYSAKSGLYFAAEDGEGYLKDFNFSTSEEETALNVRLTNLPENNLSAGNSYRMPYSAVVGTFDGSWWNASKIYRSWAVRQKWCRQFGPIHATGEIPQWYKDLPIWALLYEPTNCVEPDILSGSVTGAFAGQFQEAYHLPIALHYYGWENGHRSYAQGEYDPPGAGPKGWPLLLKQIKQHNARVVTYVQGYLFNTKFDWYRKQGGDAGAVYFSGGAPIIYDERAGGGYQFMTWMCPFSKVWQNMHAEVAAKLARYGVDGIYYDSLSGNAWSCYNPAHGHPLGGGKYSTEGARQLIAKARAAAKAVNPEVIFVSESPHEIHVGNLDGCLQFCYSNFPDNIPFFSSVYHDYLLLWGNNYNCDYPGQDQQKWRDFDAWNFIPVAQSFVCGDQLGWFAQGWLVAKEYTSRLATIRMGPASKFLTYGEMVDPPVPLNELPTVTTPPWNSSAGEKEPRTFPAVLTSAWKAPDGSLGLVFCNISEKEQQIRFKVDLQRYGLPAAGKYCVKSVTDDKVVANCNSQVIERTETIAVRGVKILEVRSE